MLIRRRLRNEGGRLLLVLLAASSALALSLSASQPSGSQQPPFKTGIDIIHVDAAVLDREGRPIRGLGAADFTVLEEGKPRRIVAFNEVTIPDPIETPAGWPRDVAPDVRHNQLPQGRLLVIVIDDAMLPFDPTMVRATKEIAGGIVDRLGPDDLASVVFTRDGRHSQDFTADRARLLQAISKTSGGFIFNDVKEMPVNAEVHFEAAGGTTLRYVAEALRGVTGRRKAIAFVSIGSPYDPESNAPRLIQPGQSMGDTVAQQRLLALTNELVGGSIGGQMPIYTFDPSGLDGIAAYAAARPNIRIPDPRSLRDTLLILANNTGGRATVDTNEWNTGLDRMFRETSSYYLLGYEASSPIADGKFRRLEITVNRPNAEVRTRRGYIPPEPVRNPATKPKPAAAILAISQVLPQGGDLRMQAAATSFAGVGRKAAIAIVVGLMHPIREAVASETVDVLVSAFDPEGRPKESKRQTATLQLRQVSDGQARYEVLTRLDVAPGRYNLRIGAHTAKGRDTGSVYVDVDVPDYSRDALSVSGLLLSSPTAPLAAPPGALADLVPVVPTTMRQFQRTDRVSGFLRVYQSGGRVNTAVSADVRLVNVRGMVVTSTQHSIGPERFSQTRAADFAFDVPIAKVPAGAYLLEVGLTQADALPVLRRVRIVVQ